MSTLRLRLKIGDAVRDLAEIKHRASDQTDLMRDLLLLMLRSTQLNFEAEGRPRWDDLAPSTEARRFRRAATSRRGRAMGSLGALGSMRILFNTGQLAQSTGQGASGPFNTATGSGKSEQNTATITTTNPGAWNQFPDPRTGRPAREFFVWQDIDAEDFLAMAADFVLGAGPYSVAA